jgi:MFS family permease
MVLLITRMPNTYFAVVLGFFAIWFALATGRAITAQAMISEVATSKQRGSFMSINGSVQQLGSGLASLAAGAIVITEKSGKINRYNWVGYLSIVVLLGSFFLARRLFRGFDKKKRSLPKEPTITHL